MSNNYVKQYGVPSLETCQQLNWQNETNFKWYKNTKNNYQIKANSCGYNEIKFECYAPQMHEIAAHLPLNTRLYENVLSYKNISIEVIDFNYAQAYADMYLDLRSKILLPSQDPLHKLAGMLHNSKYDKIIADEIISFAIKNNLLFVFVNKNHRLAFWGKNCNFVYFSKGQEFYFDKTLTNFTNKDGSSLEIQHVTKDKPEPNMIEAVWHENESPYTNIELKTRIPHVPFDIIDENGEPYCRGIVFSQNSLI